MPTQAPAVVAHSSGPRGRPDRREASPQDDGEHEAERRQPDQAGLGGDLQHVAVRVRAPIGLGVAIVVRDRRDAL